VTRVVIGRGQHAVGLVGQVGVGRGDFEISDRLVHAAQAAVDRAPLQSQIRSVGVVLDDLVVDALELFERLVVIGVAG